MNSKKIAVLWLCLMMVFSLIVIVMEMPESVKAGTIWVDDDYVVEDPTHKKTIQAAVDNATLGDTVFVYEGTYHENVKINKTINLIGISRDNTTINGSNKNPCIKIQNTTGVYINEFNLTEGTDGILIEISTSNEIVNNTIYLNSQRGISISESSYNNLSGNIIQNNSWEGIDIVTSSYHNIIRDSMITGNKWGIRIADYSENNYIINTTVSNNFGHAIRFVGFHPHNNYVLNSNILNNKRSALEVSASNITIKDCNIISNGWGEFGWSGIHITLTSNPTINNKIINTTVQSNRGYGICLENKAKATIINSSIINSTYEDLYLKGNSMASVLNTTFNKSNVHLDGASIMTVKWYLHINVKDYLDNSISNAIIEIEDNINGTYNETFTTNVNGYIGWIPIVEYIQQGIGKTYHTPHKIVAWNDTLVGYAQPVMNESKTVTIVLYNGTLLNLEPGWNLVSLPRIQSDTNLPTVLQSIEGQYDAVQWYNGMDTNDPWKHNHISKLSNWNDLNEINRTMGLWVHVTDPGGTTLVVFGDVLTSSQNIALYPGWNLVGYPSTTDKIRISALNNIFFDTDVDAIWTHNATTQTWKEITASDNFEVGKGYWMHSKVTKTWVVPL